MATKVNLQDMQGLGMGWTGAALTPKVGEETENEIMQPSKGGATKQGQQLTPRGKGSN